MQPPSKPAEVYALPVGLNSTKVIWKANVNAENITSYYITSWNGTSSTNVTIPTMSADISGFYSYTFRGSTPPLTSNRRYEISVRSINSFGAGQTSTTTVIPYNIPAPVTNLSTSLRSGYFYLQWTPPQTLNFNPCGETNNGLELKMYRIALSINNGPWAVYRDIPAFGPLCSETNIIPIPLSGASAYKARVRCLYKPLVFDWNKAMSIYPYWTPLGLTQNKLYIGSVPIQMPSPISGNNTPGAPTINSITLLNYSLRSRTIQFNWTPSTVPTTYPIASYLVYLGTERIYPTITQTGNTFTGTYTHIGPRKTLYNIRIRAVDTRGNLGVLSSGKADFVLDPYGPVQEGVIISPVPPSFRR